MKENIKYIAIFIILSLVFVLPISISNAGVTDVNQIDDGQITRKTTTNYFTTVEIKGSLKNTLTGKTITLEDKSSELEGNTTDLNVAGVINEYRTRLESWLLQNGATATITEGITNYYYNVHDEITQSGGNNVTTPSNIILVGNLNELTDSYINQGQITINTIMDKHQTYILSVEAEVKVVDEMNITLQPPKIGDKVTVKTVHNDEYNFDEKIPDVTPVATVDLLGANYKVTETKWIAGTYLEVGENFAAPFEGTFEAEKYYYALINLSATNDCKLSTNVSIKVNGEKPAEVFAVWSGTDTMCIAKIKAGSKYTILDGENQTYTPGKELVVRADGEAEKLVALRVDNEKLEEKDYDIESGSTIAKLKVAYLKTLKAGEHTLTFVYPDGEVSTTFTIDAISPKTGDNIAIFVAIFVAATIAIAVISIKKRNK